jgi:hypothetical protein
MTRISKSYAGGSKHGLVLSAAGAQSLIQTPCCASVPCCHLRNRRLLIGTLAPHNDDPLPECRQPQASPTRAFHSRLVHFSSCAAIAVIPASGSSSGFNPSPLRAYDLKYSLVGGTRYGSTERVLDPDRQPQVADLRLWSYPASTGHPCRRIGTRFAIQVSIP